MKSIRTAVGCRYARIRPFALAAVLGITTVVKP